LGGGWLCFCDNQGLPPAPAVQASFGGPKPASSVPPAPVVPPAQPASVPQAAPAQQHPSAPAPSNQ
ncbi:MAG TPA: hypothetical protein VEI07_10305, partial [Planctomycetaceae bacterium]|nr:hypothetical protein [Planctomycetaceae bacterium]